MKEYLIGFGVMIFIFVCVGSLVMLVRDAADSSYRCGYEMGYIGACADFYKGHPKYELVEHEDGTKSWEKIKEDR